MAEGPVVAIGVFDGVHRGHQELLAYAREIARERQSQMWAASFDPHPMSIVAPTHAPKLLSSPGERRQLLVAAGADEVVFIPFSAAVSELSAEEFAKTFIVDLWQASGVVVGENFRFGHKAQGDVSTLRDLGARLGFTVTVVPLVADTEPWSSSRVRTYLNDGHIAQAAEILGRPVTLTAQVVHGDHRGRELGYPTANLDVAADRLVPGDGIYAGHAAWVDGSGERVRMAAAISIGTNPQFQGADRRVEVYVLDLPPQADLYGAEMTIEFVAKVRDQVVFGSLEEYLDQMPRDITAVRALC